MLRDYEIKKYWKKRINGINTIDFIEERKFKKGFGIKLSDSFLNNILEIELDNDRTAIYQLIEFSISSIDGFEVESKGFMLLGYRGYKLINDCTDFEMFKAVYSDKTTIMK
jgi:hypothetical protein